MDCPYCKEEVSIHNGKCPKCNTPLSMAYEKVMENFEAAKEDLVGQSELDLEKELVSLIEKANILEKKKDFKGAIQALKKAIELSSFPQGIQKKIERLEAKQKEKEMEEKNNLIIEDRKGHSSLASGTEKEKKMKDDLDRELDLLHNLIHDSSAPVEEPKPPSSSVPSSQETMDIFSKEVSSPSLQEVSVSQEEDAHLQQLLSPSRPSQDSLSKEEPSFSPSSDPKVSRKKHATQQAMLNEILGEDKKRVEAEKAASQEEEKPESPLSPDILEPLTNEPQETIPIAPSSAPSLKSPLLEKEEQPFIPKKTSFSFSSFLMAGFTLLFTLLFFLSIPVLGFFIWKISQFQLMISKSKGLLQANHTATASKILEDIKRDPFFPYLAKKKAFYTVYHLCQKKKLLKDFEKELQKRPPSYENLFDLLTKLKPLLQRDKEFLIYWKRAFFMLWKEWISNTEKDFPESLLKNLLSLVQKGKKKKPLFSLEEKERLFSLWDSRLQILCKQGKVQQALQEGKQLSMLMGSSLWEKRTQELVQEHRLLKKLDALMAAKKYPLFSQILKREMKKHFLSPTLWDYYIQKKNHYLQKLKGYRKKRERQKEREVIQILRDISPFSWEKKIYQNWLSQLENE